MRILHMDTGRGWRGGQQQVLWLLEGCRVLGIEQTLLTPAGSPLAARARQSGVTVSEIAARLLTVENLRAVRRLAPQFDLAHAHDSHAHSLFCAAHPLRGRGRGWPPLVVSRRVGFPIRSLGRAKYRFASRYIAVSEYVRCRLLEAGVPEEKLRVIYDGVRPPPLLPEPEARTEFRRRQRALEGAFVFGTLSSFAPEKLLAEQLDLLKQLPASAHFWLGIPGAEQDSGSAGTALLEAARRDGLSARFRIIPVAEDAGAFLTSLDLFLYLSRMEGLGSAILLAMAHQLPVMASNVGGIPEIVRHQQTGVLVGEDRELPAAVQFLMGVPQLRRRMGEAARRFVLAHASSDKMVAQTVVLYRELLQGSTETRA